VNDSSTAKPVWRKGSVILKEWMKTPSGINVMGFYGNVVIHKAETAVGFAPSKTESNWFAQIDGESDCVVILGCQIRGIYFSEAKPTHADVEALR
jgi:hypothetical protein